MITEYSNYSVREEIKIYVFGVIQQFCMIANAQTLFVLSCLIFDSAY